MSFLNKRMSEKAFFILLGITFGLFCLFRAITSLDNDMYFMIATGRDLLRDGFITSHPEHINETLNFAPQQWLYCIVLAVLNDTNPWLLPLFVFAENILFYFLCFKFYKMKGMNNILCFLCVIFLSNIGNNYMMSVRPEVTTMILLMAEILCFEYYKKNESKLSANYLFIIGLPLLICLESNLHSSMLFMHYAIAMAYIVPIRFKGVKKDTVSLKGFIVICTVLLMVNAMRLNPYGDDAVLYLPRALSAHTFDYIDITDMQKPIIIFSPATGVCIISGILLFLVFKFKAAKTVSFNMAIGCTLLPAMAFRNIFYGVFAFLYLSRDLFTNDAVISAKIDWRKDIKRYWVVIYSIGIVVLSFMILAGVPQLSGEARHKAVLSSETYAGLYDVVDYLDEHASKTDNIFTGFGSGSYLEYKGYKHIYLDARPEIYTPGFTGIDDNILADYSGYGDTGIRYEYGSMGRIKSMKILTDDDMAAWIDWNAFDYFIVSVSDEGNLYRYLESRPDTFEFVFSKGYYRVYKAGDRSGS